MTPAAVKHRLSVKVLSHPGFLKAEGLRAQLLIAQLVKLELVDRKGLNDKI